MSRRLCALVVLLSFLILLPHTVLAGVSLRFTGGYYHMSYKDFNDWVAQQNKLIDEANAGVPPEYQVTDKYDEIHWVPEFGGEISFSVAPTVSIGVGASIIAGSSSSSYIEQGYGWDNEHKVKAYPITATAYVRFPAIPIKPYLYGGVGLYRSKLTFRYYYAYPSDTLDINSELTDWSFGLHGGGGISFNIAPTISLDLDIRLRWADLKGYEGTATSADGEKKDVFLAKGTINDTYFYGPEEVAKREDWQEASVNLSGYGFFVGLSIGF